MSIIQQRLQRLSSERLAAIRRGIEKESLRATAQGALALTPHPPALGSALKHPRITTDFSESQIEMVTGPHPGVEGCLAELKAIHQAVVHGIGDERLWVASMPCRLPEKQADIPLGQYGASHIGRIKTIYRRGLGFRYGRRMQTISGIHYNWSLPGLDNDEYFALIRNFRRHSYVLLYLFGASPAVGKCFVHGLRHDLLPLGPHTLHMPHGTSLRMGRLGYQSDAQATLAVSYNSLEGYGASLEDALTRPWPEYEKIGLRDAQGTWRQLSTHLLQIENEFYGTIRPKRTIRLGERPLHALRERGVEYVEVRCMDLDPFEDLGISAATARFLDIFLLYCLLADSPPDCAAENAALARNQMRVAAHGRDPELKLECASGSIGLIESAAGLLSDFEPIAQRLDAVHGGAGGHQAALEAARLALREPQRLPSARMLAALRERHGGEFIAFGAQRSHEVRERLLNEPWPPGQARHWAEMAARSQQAQREAEAQQTSGFEAFLADYLSPVKLG